MHVPSWLTDALTWVVPGILAITLHEAAHGWMANRFGDDTAKRLGRITLNPFKHIDRFGTLILPGLLLATHSPFLFGYAKPVPVNFARLTPPRFATGMVAIAGVGLNAILALISALLLHMESWITPEQAPWLYEGLYHSIMINSVLITFNLIPFLPLDGGRAVGALMPERVQKQWKRTERYGLVILILALMLPGLMGFQPLQTMLEKPVLALIEGILRITGNGQ